MSPEHAAYILSDEWSGMFPGAEVIEVFEVTE